MFSTFMTELVLGGGGGERFECFETLNVKLNLSKFEKFDVKVLYHHTSLQLTESI